MEQQGRINGIHVCQLPMNSIIMYCKHALLEMCSSNPRSLGSNHLSQKQPLSTVSFFKKMLLVHVCSTHQVIMLIVGMCACAYILILFIAPSLFISRFLLYL